MRAQYHVPKRSKQGARSSTKAKIKQGVGDLTGSKRLKREGREHKAKSKAR